jgi:hypothetical protein
MQTGELQTSRENVQDQFQHQLTRFVDTEIQLGYTFAALAITERIMGNMEHFRLSREDATKALAAVRKFLNHINDTESRASVVIRCQELEQAIGDL